MIYKYFTKLLKLYDKSDQYMTEDIKYIQFCGGKSTDRTVSIKITAHNN